MSLVERMKRLIDEKEEEIVLSEQENEIYLRLKENRDRLVQEVIPSSLRGDFAGIVYPDNILKFYAQAFYRDSQFGTEVPGEFALEHMKLSLSTGRFGRKLVLEGVRPESVLLEMLRGI